MYFTFNWNSQLKYTYCCRSSHHPHQLAVLLDERWWWAVVGKSICRIAPQPRLVLLSSWWAPNDVELPWDKTHGCKGPSGLISPWDLSPPVKDPQSTSWGLTPPPRDLAASPRDPVGPEHRHQPFAPRNEGAPSKVERDSRYECSRNRRRKFRSPCKGTQVHPWSWLQSWSRSATRPWECAWVKQGAPWCQSDPGDWLQV